MAITYRGVTLTYGKHSGENADRAVKVISYPGVNGTEEMDFGKRQQSLTVNGLMEDVQNGTLNIAQLESWNDTSVGDLIIHGTTYSNCRAKCRWFNIRKDAVTNKLTGEYEISFRKLK